MDRFLIESVADPISIKIFFSGTPILINSAFCASREEFSACNDFRSGKFNSFEILLIIIYSVVNLNISKGLSLMDTRLLVIAGPLLVAASWALFNIGRLAIQQIQRMK
jgi:hypothetical protein